MNKLVSIDPGKYKCGLVLADLDKREILSAIVIESNKLIKKVKDFKLIDSNIKLIIGNGTTSKSCIFSLNDFTKDLIIVDERNTTYRAKERYFQIFPRKGFQNLLPKEIFIRNINLDAISALIIAEDYLNFKFEVSNKIQTKTWLKR